MSRAHSSENSTCTATVMPNCLKNCPAMTAHEARRHEHRHDRQADRDDGEADLVGRFERRLVGRFAHADVADDVLDLDDRIVDQNAGAERDAPAGSPC